MNCNSPIEGLGEINWLWLELCVCIVSVQFKLVVIPSKRWILRNHKLIVFRRWLINQFDFLPVLDGISIYHYYSFFFAVQFYVPNLMHFGYLFKKEK